MPLVAAPDAKSANEALDVVTGRMETSATLPQIKAAAHDASESLEKCLTSVSNTRIRCRHDRAADR